MNCIITLLSQNAIKNSYMTSSVTVTYKCTIMFTKPHAKTATFHVMQNATTFYIQSDPAKYDRKHKIAAL